MPMSLWHYEKQGRSFGPVAHEHLRALWQTGQLSADDAAWPAGVDAPRRCRVAEAVAMSLAGQSPGAGSAPTERPPAEPAEESTSAGARASSRHTSAWDATRRGARRGATFLRERAAGAISRTRNAARLAALEVRRTKLRKVALPALYLALGRHVRREKLFREELSDLHSRLDALAQKLVDLRGAGESAGDEFSSLADRAGQAAHRVAAAVQSEIVSGKARRCLRELGRSAYDRFGDASGP
ncbi:MAG: DUF4339 domain-containing protein, partial [Planctomycetia bacterium]|nr:DUF4339 domain-containing protein [Planctomycetia bacterium]